MVSSTVATVLYLQVPMSLIENDVQRQSFQSLSLSVGFSWGLVFSFTLLFLCIHPYLKINQLVSNYSNDHRLSDDEATIAWIEEKKEVFSVSNNVKLITSIVSPTMASLLTTFLSRGI